MQDNKRTGNTKAGRYATLVQRRSNPRRIIENPSVVNQRSSGISVLDNRCLQSKQTCWIETIQRTAAAGVIQCARLPSPQSLVDAMKYMDIGVIKDRLEKLLQEWAKQHHLDDPNGFVQETMRVLFVDDKFKLDEYKTFCCGKSKDSVYYNPADAQAKPKEEDESRLHSLVDGALAALHGMNSVHIEKVFCPWGKVAKENYKLIEAKIKELDRKIKKMVTVDYNGDDTEQGRGGYANFDRKYVHFNMEHCSDDNMGKTTIIHECAHLSRSEIIDKGYVGTPGFDTMEGKEKIKNAAHYEVAPGWYLGATSVYGEERDFIPKSERGGETTESSEETGRRAASEYFRAAWAAATNKVTLLRDLNMDITGTLGFGHELKELSNKLGLTMHEQNKIIVKSTVLDITLMENIAHILVVMMRQVCTIPFEGTADDRIDENTYKEYFIKTVIENKASPEVNREVVEYLQKLRE